MLISAISDSYWNKIWLGFVTNSGVVPNPLGCRTLYLSERNWEIGGSRPLICCTSRCVLLSCVTYFPGQDKWAHIPLLTNKREARLGLTVIYLPLVQFVMLDRYSTITMYTDFNSRFILTNKLSSRFLLNLIGTGKERMCDALLTRAGTCLTREEIHLHGRGRHRL